MCFSPSSFPSPSSDTDLTRGSSVQSLSSSPRCTHLFTPVVDTAVTNARYSTKLLPKPVAPALCLPPESLKHFIPQALSNAWGLAPPPPAPPSRPNSLPRSGRGLEKFNDRAMLGFVVCSSTLSRSSPKQQSCADPRRGKRLHMYFYFLPLS